MSVGDSTAWLAARHAKTTVTTTVENYDAKGKYLGKTVTTVEKDVEPPIYIPCTRPHHDNWTHPYPFPKQPYPVRWQDTPVVIPFNVMMDTSVANPNPYRA